MSDRGVLFGPGSEQYAKATAPRNSSALQRPAFVARPTTAAGVAEVIRHAASLGLRVVPQSTGHGAGAPVEADSVLVDTSALNSVTVDAASRVARAGAGATWGRVNTYAEGYGLLGLAGSAPTVGVSGYTFGGGVGWLVRPHGMASAALREVEYVTGTGEIRTAAQDAPDPIDREALWAFRGGGGVGIATRLEFDLVDCAGLHAGYLLWPAHDLEAVSAAWAAVLPHVGHDVATSLSVLHLPDLPAYPEGLRGRPSVHLAVAGSTGDEGAHPLLEAVRRAASPAVDTWGNADATKLSTIHLDPPGPVPAIGDGRWLTADAPTAAAGLLETATTTDQPLVLIEIRSVGDAHSDAPGAQTSLPAPFLLHAVAPLRPQDDRPVIQEAFARLRTRAADVDTRRTAAPWMDGAATFSDALPADVRRRLAAVADAVDPEGVIARTRYLV